MRYSDNEGVNKGGVCMTVMGRPIWRLSILCTILLSQVSFGLISDKEIAEISLLSQARIQLFYLGDFLINWVRGRMDERKAWRVFGEHPYVSWLLKNPCQNPQEAIAIFRIVSNAENPEKFRDDLSVHMARQKELNPLLVRLLMDCDGKYHEKLFQEIYSRMPPIAMPSTVGMHFLPTQLGRSRAFESVIRDRGGLDKESMISLDWYTGSKSGLLRIPTKPLETFLLSGGDRGPAVRLFFRSAEISTNHLRRLYMEGKFGKGIPLAYGLSLRAERGDKDARALLIESLRGKIVLDFEELVGVERTGVGGEVVSALRRTFASEEADILNRAYAADLLLENRKVSTEQYIAFIEAAGITQRGAGFRGAAERVTAEVMIALLRCDPTSARVQLYCESQLKRLRSRESWGVLSDAMCEDFGESYRHWAAWLSLYGPSLVPDATRTCLVPKTMSDYPSVVFVRPGSEEDSFDVDGRVFPAELVHLGIIDRILEMKGGTKPAVIRLSDELLPSRKFIGAGVRKYFPDARVVGLDDPAAITGSREERDGL
jgi:hypothetical protein